MQQVHRLIQTSSHHTFPVLILGESGTGKELVARAIHDVGPRRLRPFVPVDCAALVPTLIESELFGHVKGAFTGAAHTKQGLLESARGGTLFLDEIGELRLDLQAKLLRALQEHEIRRVGATDRVRIDARIIAATNRNLASAVRTGLFRQDLYFRLDVLEIDVPPLRERRADIPCLVNLFLDRFSDLQPSVHTVSEEAMGCLIAYDWPGNVRELENAIEHAVALGSGPVIEVRDLPSTLWSASAEPSPANDAPMPLREMKRCAILRALRAAAGDKTAAAHLLGIGKTTLYRKLKRHNGQPARG